MRGRTPSEGRFVGPGSAHAALTIGSRALGASEPRQVRKEAALRTPSQVPRSRPIRAGDADSSGDTDLDDGVRGRASIGNGPRIGRTARRGSRVSADPNVPDGGATPLAHRARRSETVLKRYPRSKSLGTIASTAPTTARRSSSVPPAERGGSAGGRPS